jgi:hypothetical protein
LVCNSNEGKPFRDYGVCLPLDPHLRLKFSENCDNGKKGAFAIERAGQHAGTSVSWFALPDDKNFIVSIGSNIMTSLLYMA